MDETVTVRLPGELKSKLEAVSRKTNLRVSQLAREAIRRYLAVRQFEELRKETVPYAEEAGFLTDEDVFRKSAR